MIDTVEPVATDLENSRFLWRYYSITRPICVYRWIFERSLYPARRRDDHEDYTRTSFDGKNYFDNAETIDVIIQGGGLLFQLRRQLNQMSMFTGLSW